MSELKKKRKAEVCKKDCVACGTCFRECPLGALSSHKGIYAKVDLEKCVGCGKCAKACPAGVIDIVEMFV